MSDGSQSSESTPRPELSPGQNSPAMGVRQRLRRTIIATVLFVAALLAYLLSHFIPKIPEPLPDFFLALTAAMAVHLLDRLLLFRDTVESLDHLRRQIVGNVAKDTKALIGQLDEHTKDAMEEILASIQKSIES